MPWGAAIAAVAAVGGAKLQSNAANKSAKAQAASAAQGMKSEERMFDKSLELQKPYREAGYGALSGLQGLATPEGRASSLNSFYGSGEYAAMQQQQEQQVMRSAAMTGGMRSGGNQVALGAIAPQLGQNYLSNQYNQLSGIASMGMGTASQGAQGYANLGGSMNLAQQQIGQSQAQNYLAQGNIASNTVGTLGGIAADYFNKP